MKDTEIYNGLINAIDKTVSVRVHSFEINYFELIQRAISNDKSAVCGVAHCLFWGEGGQRNEDYAKILLRKLSIEKLSVTAEYLLAHYAIIDGETERGFLKLKVLSNQGFLPAKTLYYYLGFKNDYGNVSLDQVREILLENAEKGHLKAWFLIMRLARYYPFPKRIWKSVCYCFRFLRSGFLKKTKNLESAEKAFLFD